MKDKRQTDYAILQREYTKKQGMTNVWTRLLTQSATVHKGAAHSSQTGNP